MQTAPSPYKNDARRREQFRRASAKYRARNPGRHDENMRRLYEKRKDTGLCVRCGSPERLTEAVCWDCLNYMEGSRL